jgi:hypothetical protein
MRTSLRPWSSAALHALIVLGAYSALFTWLFAQPIITHRYLSESDLYDYFLPIFLAPITTWSLFEYSGMPAFADPGDFVWYPPHFFFARIVHSWTGLVISGFVLAAIFTYAYVYRVTRSRTAAAFSGIAYGMSEALVERIPHLGTMHCFAWLPLILLAVEHLRQEGSRRWMAIGAAGVACAFLAGHPQPFVYTMYLTGAYALAAGLTARANRRYYLAVTLMYLLGAVLASIKTIPLVEASTLMARQFVNLGQFVDHSNTPTEFLSALFPSILHDGREAPTYVGVATLLFAFVGASLWRHDWRIPFWMGATTLAVIFGVGEFTPIPQLFYKFLPLYDKFRVVARHLFLAAFGAAFLAGYAIAALQRAAITRRRIVAAAAALGVLVLLGATIQAAAPAAFRYEPRLEPPFHLPLWNAGVWVQVVLAIITIGAALVLKPGRRFVAGIAVLIAILYLDDLYSLLYRDTMLRMVPITLPAAATQPSVHDERLRSELEPLHQRVMAIGGTTRDPVIPASFARVWQIPIAGGYGPMLLQRTADVGMMGHEGAPRFTVEGAQDRALDLLAVRYILVHPDDVAPPGTFEQDGVQWDKNDLGLAVGRADCGFSYARSQEVPLPLDVNVSEVAVVTYLRCSEDEAQGTEVAQLRVVGSDGAVVEQRFRAGVETAEAALTEASVMQRAQHHIPENRFRDPSNVQALRFVTRVKLETPVRGGRVELTAPGTHGWFTIDRLTVIDDAGVSHPISGHAMWLSDANRWREAYRFATSRETDRGSDRDAPGETPTIVYENVRALPRAWMVPAVRALDDRDALAAVHYGQFPDGASFDPRATALVSPDDGPTQPNVAATQVSATVTEVAPDRITIDANSDGGGFLVLSETYYPGWRARIDGVVTRVRRADFSLQGLPIPPGRHTVVFEFKSRTLQAGTGLTIGGILVCLVLVALPRRL